MRYLLLALLVLVPCCGCIVAVKDDGSAPSEPPPPPPPTRVVVAGEASESFALKYVKDVPLVFEAMQKACARLNIKITDTNKPGSGNNWTATGYHANGSFDFNIYMHRRDHKSTATVTVKSGRFGEQQCREWTRRIHAEIGSQLGEDGRN
jgi:hypothetical protein